MENRNSNQALGLFLMVGLIVAALIWSDAYKGARQLERMVSVKGLCEKEVKADKVICPFAYKIGGNDLQALNASVAKNNAIIKRFLKDAGITDDEITVAAPKIVDTRTEWSGSKNTYDYIITSVITACTDKVDCIVKLQSRQGELLQQGIITTESWEYPTIYSFTKLNDIKPEMIEQATQNAREAAKKFAEDSDSKLGKIKRASQGQFSISDRDSNTPYIKNVRVVTSIDYYLND